MKFKNAQEAFETYYNILDKEPVSFANTKALFNQSIIIENPLDRDINTPWRKWNKNYAEYEWEWYLSGNPSVKEIKLRAKIWDKMHNGDNLVNSNYGFQWNRSKEGISQIDYVLDELINNKDSRRAFISIYDGKEHSLYKNDTPCTLSIGFYIYNDLLYMDVLMRSNDLWYGFCNDQYCFSKLQELIANKLGKKVGHYHHYATNLHLYEGFFNKNI